MTDAVNHPKHYNEHPSGIECIQVVEHMCFKCDRLANRVMADKQKGWDMERVALLQKLRAHGIGAKP